MSVSRGAHKSGKFSNGCNFNLNQSTQAKYFIPQTTSNLLKDPKENNSIQLKDVMQICYNKELLYSS